MPELTPAQQSVLNSTVFTALCNEEIWSIIRPLKPEQRVEALRTAIDWSIAHSLCDDDDSIN